MKIRFDKLWYEIENVYPFEQQISRIVYLNTFYSNNHHLDQRFSQSGVRDEVWGDTQKKKNVSWRKKKNISINLFETIYVKYTKYKKINKKKRCETTMKGSRYWTVLLLLLLRFFSIFAFIYYIFVTYFIRVLVF